LQCLLPYSADLYFPDDVHLSRESEDLIRQSVSSSRSSPFAAIDLCPTFVSFPVE
jgi:hypothetical protein